MSNTSLKIAALFQTERLARSEALNYVRDLRTSPFFREYAVMFLQLDRGVAFFFSAPDCEETLSTGSCEFKSGHSRTTFDRENDRKRPFGRLYITKQLLLLFDTLFGHVFSSTIEPVKVKNISGFGLLRPNALK